MPAEPGRLSTTTCCRRICYGGERVGFPIINRHLFGANAPLRSVYSFQMVGASTGMALGGFLGVPLSLWLPRHQREGGTPVNAMAPA